MNALFWRSNPDFSLTRLAAEACLLLAEKPGPRSPRYARLPSPHYPNAGSIKAAFNAFCCSQTPKAALLKSWIDAAKGLAIWLIVTTHAINEFRALPGFDMHGRTAEIIDFYCTALAPMRLPLFFILSGALAARTINGSWPALMKRKVWFSSTYSHSGLW